ncbi:fatty aldehyde dehydrogenase [Caballeronia terrestris]|uniref:2,5-dioxovalerate dehydrogenase n=1 Tax=Caballeronia terrestris TaxID=1226301 RepID=A0A158IDU9_9BURK|nr:aldehyde dehydrogenase (NADP(+)) [Caballeronia terrestris]SAL54724.1 fatty aldehyde dehydrogenase [Caballeronia terrestris]
MKITGEMLIGATAVRGSDATLRAFDPARNADLEPVFGGGGAAEVARACELAEAAFEPYRRAPLETRAQFLEAIADNIVGLGDALIERAHAESALPKARLEGERARTIGQLRLFASLVREGRWLDATLDSAQPDRKPLPRPDLRLQKIPVGPVAVFGASNFPLAFSVAGGDTVSAFAAGCPVVVKSHPAHLGTSELVGRAIQKAVADSGLPEGVFSLVVGAGNAIGEALVAHPAIRSVGFTGSRRGGLALLDIASKRPEPIPVFAEMSSVNPLFALPGALAVRGDALATAFVDSVTLGVGQFCTSPGLVIAVEGPHLQEFIDAASAALDKKGAQTMLTAGIAAAYADGIEQRDATGVARMATGASTDAACSALPALYQANAEQFLTTPQLQDEIFGPTSLIVVCADEDEMIKVARRLEGQLTATLHLEGDDFPLAKRLIPVLERKVGRILANGFPTGVEVSYAMVHGGPYPATSDSRSTSVGALAIERFLRPVCYQDLPAALLPQSLADDNPLNLWRLRDGELGPN